MFTVSTKKKTLQMYLMKRSVCSPQRGLGDFLAQVIAHRLESRSRRPSATIASTPARPRRRLTSIGTSATSSTPARTSIAI